MNRVAHWWRPALLLCVLAGVPLLSAQEPGAAKSADGKIGWDRKKFPRFSNAAEVHDHHKDNGGKSECFTMDKEAGDG